MKENNNEVNEINKDEKIKKEEYQTKLQDFKEFRDFESIDELLKYCRKSHKTSEGLTVLDYYKNLAGCSDVIRMQNSKTSMMYTAVDEDGYGIYNNKRSIYKGKFIWEYNYGSIRYLYKPFKERGIDFVNDVHGKIDERNQSILKYCRENNLFNMGQNN